MEIKEALHPKGTVKAFNIQLDSMLHWTSDSLKETTLILFGDQGHLTNYSVFRKTLIRNLGTRRDLHIYQVVDKNVECQNAGSFIRCVAMDSFLMQKLMTASLQIPDSMRPYPAVLVDSMRQIRRFYSLEDTASYVPILEHLAFLLPPLKKKKVILRQ